MKTLEFIKLNESGANNVVASLQQLLANFQVYYTNLRGFHWNIKGHDFFVLHSQFEKMYDDTAEKVDEIAERILLSLIHIFFFPVAGLSVQFRRLLLFFLHRFVDICRRLGNVPFCFRDAVLHYRTHYRFYRCSCHIRLLPLRQNIRYRG